jgi:hypothetical protein
VAVVEVCVAVVEVCVAVVLVAVTVVLVSVAVVDVTVVVVVINEQHTSRSGPPFSTWHGVWVHTELALLSTS